ncbi:MAG: ATP-binding protein [Myxococcota bacterium]|nr:ATP-binding protein [Myxococcota bacterium]
MEPAVTESASLDIPWLDLAELIILGWSAVLVVLGAFLIGRLFRSLRHGFSIRLQLFGALFLTSLLVTTMIGWWGVERIEAKASVLLKQRGLSTELITSLIEEFGPKMGILLLILSGSCALSAYALGRGIARPLERLVEAAEAVALRRSRAPLPPPAGREVRRLTEAFVAMHDALEGRRRFEHFITDLSHDLKNPVAAIRASTEVLLSGAGEEAEPRARFLSRIDEAGSRLEHLLSDFLTLARLEASNPQDDPEPVVLDRVARQAVDGMRTQAELKGIELCVEVDPVRLWGSSTWLRRALDNLLSNAIRHSPEGGKILCKLSLEASKAQFLICDEGPGVNPAIARQIFDRFVTMRGEGESKSGRITGAEGQVRRGGGGSGLGLAVVQEVCGRHRGEVTLLKDGPLSGACFCLSLRGSRGQPRLDQNASSGKRLPRGGSKS